MFYKKDEQVSVIVPRLLLIMAYTACRRRVSRGST